MNGYWFAREGADLHKLTLGKVQNRLDSNAPWVASFCPSESPVENVLSLRQRVFSSKRLKAAARLALS